MVELFHKEVKAAIFEEKFFTLLRKQIELLVDGNMGESSLDEFEIKYALMEIKESDGAWVCLTLDGMGDKCDVILSIHGTESYPDTNTDHKCILDLKDLLSHIIKLPREFHI
jgi:hypothetical protein